MKVCGGKRMELVGIVQQEEELHTPLRTLPSYSQVSSYFEPTFSNY